MNLSGDIVLRNSLWNQAEEKLCGNFIFGRLVDLFIVACSIGIKDDQMIENDLSTEESKSIGRNTYLVSNEDLTNIITFLFHNAVLNSKHLDFAPEIRMRIAFDPDFPDEKNKISFSPTSFLVKFASYGLKKMLDVFDSNELTYIENLKELISSYMVFDYQIIMKEIKEEINRFDKKGH